MLVYVVEDDPAVLRSCTALLESHGFQVLPRPSAEAFLETFDPDAEAAVLVDIRMPGMNGLDLQSELRARGSTAPIIILTGHGDVPAAVRALKAGAIDFIEKPADVEQLLLALEDARAVLRNLPRRTVPEAEVGRRLALLTERERDVLDHLLLGRINKEIAKSLQISQRTVEIHRARIRDKMQARGLSDLILMMR